MSTEIYENKNKIKCVSTYDVMPTMSCVKNWYDVAPNV